MLPVAICFSREDAAYISGETLWGEIRFSLTEPVKVRGVYITIKGKGKVQVGKDKHEQVFINKFAPLWKPDDEPYLHDGCQLPWAFDLPDSLPSSFDGKHARVSYYVEVTVDRIRALDWHEKKNFIVMERHRLDGYPSSQDEITQKVVEKVGIGFHRRPVDISLYLPSHALVMRLPIPIRIRVCNHSTRDIDHIVLRLRQIYTLMLNNQKAKYAHTVFKKDGGKVAAGRDVVWDDRQLVLPGLACTGGCWPYIQVEYVLKFMAQFGFSGPELQLESPVVVGTSLKDANGETKDSTHPAEDQTMISENVVFLNHIMIDAKDLQKTAFEVTDNNSNLSRNSSKDSLDTSDSNHDETSHKSDESSIAGDFVEATCPYCQQTFTASPATVSEINNRFNVNITPQSSSTTQQKRAIPLVVNIKQKTSRSNHLNKSRSQTPSKRKAPLPPTPPNDVGSNAATSLSCPTTKTSDYLASGSAKLLGCKKKENLSASPPPKNSTLDSSARDSINSRSTISSESSFTQDQAVKLKLKTSSASTEEKLSLTSPCSTGNSKIKDFSPSIASMQMSSSMSRSINDSHLIYTSPSNIDVLSRSSSLPRSSSRATCNTSISRMGPIISESNSYPDISDFCISRPRSPPPPYSAEPEIYTYPRRRVASRPVQEGRPVILPTSSEEQETISISSQSQAVPVTAQQYQSSELSASNEDDRPTSSFSSHPNRNPFRR